MTPGEAALRNAPAASTPVRAAFKLIGEWRGRVAAYDRACTGGRSPARSARITEHPLRQVRKLSKVLIHEGIAASGETGEPVFDVGGVARFRHLRIHCIALGAGTQSWRPYLALTAHPTYMSYGTADRFLRPRG
jgi:hypothetical protein